jgi:hypothetical protein
MQDAGHSKYIVTRGNLSLERKGEECMNGAMHYGASNFAGQGSTELFCDSPAQAALAVLGNYRGIEAHNDDPQGFAGFFAGRVKVVGKLSKSGGGFLIDDPLHPEERYLSHSFVESDRMLNVYCGNVTTDQEGSASVSLPTYFEALNGEFCYQLTVIGQAARAVVEREIDGNAFTIRTDAPNVRVSWQVTGVRHDPWATQNPLVVEEEKPPGERGTYLHPEAHGKPSDRAETYSCRKVPRRKRA